jgi:hypothetical protein
LFSYANSDNTLVGKTLVHDFNKLKHARTESKWLEDSPINVERFWGSQDWPFGKPSERGPKDKYALRDRIEIFRIRNHL